MTSRRLLAANPSARPEFRGGLAGLPLRAFSNTTFCREFTRAHSHSAERGLGRLTETGRLPAPFRNDL